MSNTMVKTPRILYVYLAFYLLHICSGFPVDVRTQDGGASAGLWAAPLVSVAVLLAAVLLLLGCTCCRHNKGFQEFTDSASSHSLAGPGPANATPATAAGPGPGGGGGGVGYVNSAASSAEFTMFPPAAAAAAPGDRSSVVHFEPLPDVGSARLQPPQAPAPSRKPASFNNVVSGGLSARDWLEDPHANFPRHQLKYLRELGRGWFGRVVEGEAQNIINSEKNSKVVVKILREDATPTDQMYFLHEVRYHRDLNHPNILRLLGRCLEKDPFLLLLEASPGGDVKTFLMQNASTADVLNQQGVTLKMACNIAAGLHHMHSKGFVHTDLAARNCLITSDLTVKIGDYGTSIENFKDDYYCAGDIALPIRWCAPETLHCTETTIETKEVTPNANVWNLGVVLWEICEFGKLPYAELTDDEVIVKVLGEGTYRLPLPSYISPYRNNFLPPAFWILRPCMKYLLMKLCWEPVVKRPALDQVVRMLNHLHLSHDQYIGEESSLQTDEDFERRWESFKPNTIPKTDNHTLPRQHHQGGLPISFIEQKAFVLPRPSGESMDVMSLSIIAPEVSSSSPMTTSPQLSLTSSSGGDFFTPNLQQKQKSASLQDLHGSVENLCETSIDEHSDTFVRTDVAIADNDRNTMKFSESLGVVESKNNELENIISEPDFDSWLQGVETTNEEDAKFVMKISEAIRDLDNALAQEKTSSSSSEVSSHTVSHHESPAKDIVASEQNVVLDFRLGIPAEIETGKTRESEAQLDSLQEESFPYKTFHHESKTTDSGTDTEDETWRKRIERGEFSEKVKEKSKSVADLMILTHIECSDGSDSEPPSLTWNFERSVNSRNSLSRQHRSSAVKSACFPIAGSEGNIHQAVLGEEFFSTLVKLHEAQKDGNKNRLTINSLSSQSSEINLTPSPTHDPLMQRSSPFSDDSASEVHSLLSSDHAHKKNFLAINASERKSELTDNSNSDKPIKKEVLIDSQLTERIVLPDANYQPNKNYCEISTIENALISCSKQEPTELKSLINSFLETERQTSCCPTMGSTCSRPSFNNTSEFERLSCLDHSVGLKDNSSAREDNLIIDDANNDSVPSLLHNKISNVDSSKTNTSFQYPISENENIDIKKNKEISVSDTGSAMLLVDSNTSTLAPDSGLKGLSPEFFADEGFVKKVQDVLSTADDESVESIDAVCDQPYAEKKGSNSIDELKLCPDETSEQNVAVLISDNFDSDNEIQVSGHSLPTQSLDEREKNILISNNLSIPYITSSDEDYSGSVILGASEEFTMDYFKGLNTAFKDGSTYGSDSYVYSEGGDDSKLDLGMNVPFIVKKPNEIAKMGNDDSLAHIQLTLEQNETSQPLELNGEHVLTHFVSSERTLSSTTENISPFPLEYKENNNGGCISLSPDESNISISSEAVTEVVKKHEQFPKKSNSENENDTKIEGEIDSMCNSCNKADPGFSGSLEQTNCGQESNVNADASALDSDVLSERYTQDTVGQLTENFMQMPQSDKHLEETPGEFLELAVTDSCGPVHFTVDNDTETICTKAQTGVSEEALYSLSNVHLNIPNPMQELNYRLSSESTITESSTHNTSNICQYETVIEKVPFAGHNDGSHLVGNETECAAAGLPHGDQSKSPNVNIGTLAPKVDATKAETERVIPPLVNLKQEVNSSAPHSVEAQVGVSLPDNIRICTTTLEKNVSKGVYTEPPLLPESEVTENINALSSDCSSNSLHGKAEFLNIDAAGNDSSINECKKEIEESMDDKIWTGPYLASGYEIHTKEQSMISCTSEKGKMGLEDTKSELQIPSLNLISATPVDSEQTSPDTSIVANIFDVELVSTTKPVEEQKTGEDVAYEREIVDEQIDNIDNTPQKCTSLNEEDNLRVVDPEKPSAFSDPNCDLKTTLSDFILKEVIHSSLEKSCLLAAKQAILPLVELSKTESDKETISDSGIRLHPEEKSFHIPAGNINNTITRQLHIDTKKEDLEINNLESFLSKNAVQTDHAALDFLRGGVDEKIEMCLTSKQLSFLDSGEDSLSEASPNKVEKWNHQHKAHISGDEMLHVTFDEKNYEHSRKLHDYQVRFNQDVIVELDDELGLDVVKHSTPDDERSSDSGFRDKGSLSESCEDACDEKYNLEDIEAELEETFNKGGFNYSAKGEECDEDAEHRSTALDFPDDSFSIQGNRDEIANIDIMNHKKCDSDKILESNINDPDKMEKCVVPTNYVTSLEQLNTEFSPLNLNLNINAWKGENESYQFSDNFLELNVPVLSEECVTKDQLNTYVLNNKDNCGKEECNERCICSDNVHVLAAVRGVTSETPLKVCANSVKKEDIFLENDHFPVTDHSGWFLHEPNDKRFKNSDEDECSCNYDSNIPEENLSPGSSSSDSFKNDDSSGSDKYVPLSLDEEFVAAIRNELRDKLPCAQQQTHPDEIDDVDDDLQREEERTDITILYNVYTAPLSPILEERESVSSLTATISENYPIPSSIMKGKQKDEFDSEPVSPVFLNDIFGESSDYCEEQEKRRFEEEIRQALANCSVSSVDTDSDQHKNSVISEDLEEDFQQPNDVASNDKNEKTVKDAVNQHDDYDDDFLVVNTETNEVTLLESPKPKSYVAFVKEFEDTSEKPASQLADSNSITRSGINFSRDTASDDEVFTPDSISPGGNERSSPVNEMLDITGSFTQDESHDCDSHSKTCCDMSENNSTDHMNNEPAKILLEPMSSSKEKAYVTEDQDYDEFIQRHRKEQVKRSEEMDAVSVDESIEDKSESLSEAENKTPEDNSKSESFSEALSEPISLGTHQTGVENTLKRHQCYDDLSTGFTQDGDLTTQAEETNSGDQLDVSGFCERGPESYLCTSLDKSADTDSHKKCDVKEFTEHSELINSLKMLMNQNRADNYSENIADSDKNEGTKQEESETQLIDQMSERGPVLNDTLKLYRKRKEAEAAISDERDWLSAGREASALSTKAPMPSPEEESWKQLPSMLAFSADLNSAEEKDTGFSPVPAAVSDDLMSTSFSLKEEDFGDCYTPDWESGSEDTNEEDNSSSSGEFIWKEGDKEAPVKALSVTPASNPLKAYEGLSDFPMEVIEEEEEDDDDNDDDDDDSSSSGSGAEFVPSAWNSEATPNRSALRSPDKRSEDDELSEQKKNVSFKKQKYHCVYEYPREVSDSDSEGIESPSRKRWDMYQPPSVDYASYADWDLVLEGDVPEQLSQDTDAEPDVKKASSIEQFDFYKLSSVDYDFASGAVPEDREFFISSTARPFQFNPSSTDSLVGSNVSQFFPGKESILSSVKSSDCTNLEILPVPSVCDSEADHTDTVNNGTCVTETSPQKIQTQGVTGSPTKLEFKDKKFPWNSSKIESKDRLATDSPTLRPKQGMPLTVDRVARPDDRDSPPELLSPSSPLSPSGLGELRHTRDRLKLDLPPSGSPFLLDPPSGAKRRSLVEAVKGEASLLDSGEETEDSGIESSNGHRSGDVIEGSGHI
ncbi:uncharacterized protein LOC126334745 isoform X4 [Schistocerca gregaria]|uniref:uncharacterized protein LOC126334745 isoform X4 n=1 Tax=Schistocerca gregaria TaxID=7010 RepID=UPI00211E35BB|nr:uncharacterized protein LOC126334745 isoform X4 [Schistocerca gregaria]